MNWEIAPNKGFRKKVQETVHKRAYIYIVAILEGRHPLSDFVWSNSLPTGIVLYQVEHAGEYGEYRVSALLVIGGVVLSAME